MSKYDHVRKAVLRAHAGNHECHWPDCTRKVPPAVWGCKTHWYALPQTLRNKIWASYRAGQEINKTPSRRYIETAHEVQNWIYENHPETRPRLKLEYDL